MSNQSGENPSIDQIREKFHVTQPDGEEVTVERIQTPEFESTAKPCPACGNREFVEINSNGGLYGGKTGSLRNDYGFLARSLFVACSSCKTVLYQEPMAELVYTLEKYNGSETQS